MNPQARDQDRRNASLNAKLMASRPNLAVRDTETTGLDHQAQAIQIALINRQGDVLLDSLVKPTVPIPEEASRVHGINGRHLKDAPTIAELEPTLRQLLRGRFLAAYNAEFDLRIVNQSLVAHHLPPLHHPAEDTGCIMQLYSAFHSAWHSYHRSYTFQSLTSAIRQCNLQFEGQAHSALADAQAALAVLKHMAKSTH